ncbi:PaaX family transcriptional regulator C-terminal domain-containing protein [Streptomyces virginiae]|uniref:PaaX family transcriptional regulator C-terminal domain-containing protein n=1 Tax=Streptomyces TaxID=1883 RepID=UPI000527BE9D|nr:MULTISPECIES: PaaX family transcriptional regulator C-terminal domain-containing protein [Streptomyces]MCX4714888.1 transcriptional regulator [Streptomyces virginiae]MCX5272606.1 transcriptional regulator [Streptomyces virginiae]MYV75550.1 transcriptional regulator [Streptomyces sp. SID1046]
MSAIPTRMVVHALVREDGTVAGEELYEVAALLGMTDQQVRLCVKRLVTEGRFTVEGRGRRAVLRLAGTEQGAAPALVPEVEFVRHAYRQDRGLEPWDGCWHAFAFAVPESARAARDSLRDALTGLGAAPVQGGLYVTPNAIGPYIRAHAADLDLSEALTCLSTRDLVVGGTRDPRALAERLWPLPEIAERYGELRALAERPPEPGPAAGPAHAVALAAAFSAAMLPDPLLPPELLPQPWPGATARAAASEAWARLGAAAPAGGPRLFRLYGEALA